MFRTALLFLHRWLGLVSGAIVFVVSITGAIFVFEEELFRLFHPGLVYVTPKEERQDINTLKEAAQQRIGADKKIDFVFIYGEADRAYCFSALKRNPGHKGLWDSGEIDYYYQVFVDPYTGAVLGVVNRETEFFIVVRRIHQNLLLRRDIGNMIVGSSVLVFLVILISGVVLWWPRRMAAWKQRVTIRLKARWRRVNYDLHSVLGFYSFLLAMIIAASGLVWSFDWWENGVYKALGSSKKELLSLRQRDTVHIASANGVTLAWQDALQHYEHFQRMVFSFPSKENSRISAFVQYNGPSAWTDTDYRFYNGGNGDLIREVRHEDKTTGLKWRNSNYNIHTGKIYGWPTQVLALLAGIICASLPMTGFIMWLGRKKKPAVRPEAPEKVKIKEVMEPVPAD